MNGHDAERLLRSKLVDLSAVMALHDLQVTGAENAFVKIDNEYSRLLSHIVDAQVEPLLLGNIGSDVSNDIGVLARQRQQDISRARARYEALALSHSNLSNDLESSFRRINKYEDELLNEEAGDPAYTEAVDECKSATHDVAFQLSRIEKLESVDKSLIVDRVIAESCLALKGIGYGEGHYRSPGLIRGVCARMLSCLVGYQRVLVVKERLASVIDYAHSAHEEAAKRLQHWVEARSAARASLDDKFGLSATRARITRLRLQLRESMSDAKRLEAHIAEFEAGSDKLANSIRERISTYLKERSASALLAISATAPKGLASDLAALANLTTERDRAGKALREASSDYSQSSDRNAALVDLVSGCREIGAFSDSRVFNSDFDLSGLVDRFMDREMDMESFAMSMRSGSKVGL